MPRLEVYERTGGPSLHTLPRPPSPAACEVVSCAVAAAAHAGADVAYPDLLCSGGAAFMLRVSSRGFRHEDAVAGRGRFLAWAMAGAGMGGAWAVEQPPDPLAEALPELSAGRPAVVVGCFPEAPWRAGLVVGMPTDGLWAVLDCAGRVHSLAARAALLLSVGEPASPAQTPPDDQLRRCLWCWEGLDDCEGPGAWRAWLELLGGPAPSDADEAHSQATAHDLLLEGLADGRTHAASWLADRALEADGVTADWLADSADALTRAAGLLEKTEPALAQPQAARRFSDPGWRRSQAAVLADVAELDLTACRALGAALTADYPPGEV